MSTDEATVASTDRRGLQLEVLLVLGVSLGMDGLYALDDLLGRLTAPTPLASQQAVLNGSQAPGRPWLDLSLQLLGIFSGIIPAGLALFLLVRGGIPLRAVGLDRSRPKPDGAFGAGLACLIGIPGLGLVIAAHALGINAQVVAEDLPSIWWRYPVLILSAFQNGALEEIVVVGYLITRLQQIGWRPSRALVASSVLRGSYHLYQGFGGFLGNFVMGLIFGYFFQRTKRVVPLIVAHTLIDAVSFVGYALLHGHVSWLP